MSGNRIPEIRQDSVFKKWVIISPARAKRPSDFKSKKNSGSQNPSSNSSMDSCPFCINHEHECPPEIFRVPHGTSQWRIRVIQNLYPALQQPQNPNPSSQDLDPLVEKNHGSPNYIPLYHSSGSHSLGIPENPIPEVHVSRDLIRSIPGLGFHDVVIESPEHSVALWDLPPHAIGDVLLAYRERMKQLLCNEFIRYIQVFKNHGASAGASMSHSHSQIMALPIIPPSVSARLDSMKEHFERTGKCLLCEIHTKDLLIDESAHFFAIAPFAASFPFEIWIVPSYHSSHFEELDSEKAVDLGGLLKLMLQKLYYQLENPPFNYMIHTSPSGVPSGLPYSHWFLQIVPQLSVAAGFEIGSGCYINPVFPEDAVKVLREVKLPV
ncbi:hypothetical protein AMTRI_Chr03g55670 [Amborella trichopoda]